MSVPETVEDHFKNAGKLVMHWNAPIPEGYEVKATDESTCTMVVAPKQNEELRLESR